jgi:hypothetical protein
MDLLPRAAQPRVLLAHGVDRRANVVVGNAAANVE